jgi:predicted permease
MGLRISVKLISHSGLRRALVLTSLFRFVLAPLLATLNSILAGFMLKDTLQFIVVSATPPAVMNAIIAEKYIWSPEVVAILIVLLLLVVFPVLYIVFTILH